MAGSEHPPDPWDVYWRGTRENAAHQQGGPQEAALESFWLALFQSQPAGGRLLDVACGNGAVTGFAQASGVALTAHAVDYSLSAAVQLCSRYPTVRAVQADAARLPFADQTMALVCSQFGIEYAGIEAFAEAARLVAGGGSLATVTHVQDGAIYQECAANLQAAEAIIATDVLLHARPAFNAGFDINEGIGDVAVFKAAERSFTPAVRALEQVIASHGTGAAGGLAQQIYRDIAQMYRRMSAYARADVLGWIDGMTAELDAYCGRMATMQRAALSASQRSAVHTQLAAQGLRVTEDRALALGQSSNPAAQITVWQRPR